tara:strand:- start:564 stop:737 length:174 start_codon:yes stop_codon:yes gene_type:complete
MLIIRLKNILSGIYTFLSSYLLERKNGKIIGHNVIIYNTSLPAKNYIIVKEFRTSHK